MRVRLAYGSSGLEVDLPDGVTTVVEPRPLPAAPDEAAAIRAALAAPMGTQRLRDLAISSDTVAIVFSDGTRPQPRRMMIPALLEELSHVPASHIVLVNALGTHRPNTAAELCDMLGEVLVSRYRVVQHDAWNRDRMVRPDGIPGSDTWVNAEYMRADVRILTGFVEPHFFAGFSGGPKSVMPGLMDQRSVLANHCAERIDHPSATWMVAEGNPIWEEMRDVALATRPTFALNVTLDRHGRVAGAFAGDLLQAHAAARRQVASSALVPVEQWFDIVVTSNAGFPLDQNLYQTVKGMSAASRIVRPGGSIVVAAECRDGLPAHGDYARLLTMASSPRALLEAIRHLDPPCQDQWQVQIQAMVQCKAQVYVKSDGLAPEAIRAARLRPCNDVSETVRTLLRVYGLGARVCVLPDGPMTVPSFLGKGAPQSPCF